MKRLHLAALVAATAAVVATATGFAFGGSTTSEPSPIYGVTIPDGYRQWELVAPAQGSRPVE